MATLLFFFFVTLLFHSCSSFDQQQWQQQQLLLPLTHTRAISLSNTNSTPFHHLLKSTSRHLARRGRRNPRLTSSSGRLSLPLSSGSDYILSLSLGPPSSAVSVSLFLDTGSDLLWFPCRPFSCILCENKPNYNGHSSPPLPPLDSKLLPCSSHLCSSAHSSLPTSDLCAAASCPLDSIETSSCSSHPCPPLYYAYGDGSLLAHLRRGRLSLSPSLTLHNFTFACAHTTLAEPVGVAGFGRGPLSLPAQLASLYPSLSKRFSYCLVAHSFRSDRLLRPSPLILGRSPTHAADHPDQADNVTFVYTPLLSDPKHPYFYSVALESITVGSSRIIPRPELGYVDRQGNGGMVIDSGTTFTMLPEETLSLVAAEFDLGMTAAGFRRSKETETQTALGPCYYYSDRDLSRAKLVPAMSFHFKGDATVELPRRNYFMGFQSAEGKKVGCLMLMSTGSGGDEGPAGTWGNIQQQGFEVVYDLEAGRVGFARRQCTKLWDDLARA